MANSFPPSAQQIPIYNWFATAPVNESLVVEAFAGCGKTTTICEALRHQSADLVTLVCAFGKDIQLELERRLAGVPNVTVKTLHALGLSQVKRFWPDVKISFGSDREKDLAERVCGPTVPDAIKKLVATLCTKGRLCNPHAAKYDDLMTTAIEFECEPDEEWEEMGFDLAFVCQKALDAMILAAAVKPVQTGIDGADMLFLPVRNMWLRKMFDRAVVDEAQDMNACQLELVEGVCRGGLVVVGDSHQAIFGFAGADSGSLSRLQKKHNAKVLPLSKTYRCGRSIVDIAKGYVPEFEAADSNCDGLISTIMIEQLTAAAGPGDFILSRVNAPLVSIAMKLLRAGKRTRVAGQDIGKGLVTLVNKLKGRSVPDLLAKIERWSAKEAARLQKQMDAATNGRRDTIQSKIDGIYDKAQMLITLTDGAPSVHEVTARIESLFADKGEHMIVCSSVHKAKGKEADKVFILRDTLRAGGEEDNIAYVAITRAKRELVWVKTKQEVA